MFIIKRRLLASSNNLDASRRSDVVMGQTASMEDYLEAIIMLSEGGKAVSVTQISKALGVKKPSVTAALKRLSGNSLVSHERYGNVELSAEGEKIARDVFQRHEALRHFLIEILDIDPGVAADDACKMEHSVSSVTSERLAKFVEFILTRPQGQPDWLKFLNYYFEHGKSPKECVTRGSRRDK